MKICTKCKLEKPVESFGKSGDKRIKDPGLKSWCKKCNNEYQKAIYANNPKKQRERAQIYRDKYSEKYKISRLANRRNIHIAESARKYKTTKARIIDVLSVGKCEICLMCLDFKSANIHHRPNIDHDHKTMKVRGLLCGYCNNLIGRARDDVAILHSAIKYLNERK
jgi:hypothetical protein